MLIRKPKHRITEPTPLPSIRTVPVPVGLLKTIVQRCEETVVYGDKKAAKAKWERADAADFYRRAAEIAMEELTKISNQKGE